MNPTPPTPIWTGPVILTLCIAGLAFVMSGVALGWQIRSWRHSGPQVKVVRIQGIGATPEGIWFIGVGARNSGRLGTEVQQFGFKLTNGQIITALSDWLGLPIQLPMPLGPGGEVGVMYSVRGIHDALRGLPGERVRPFVKTGHGTFEGKEIDLARDVALLIQTGHAS